MIRLIVLAATHIGALGIGFALGIYALPILTAPPAPDAAATSVVMESSNFSTEFSRDRTDSDFLHWGEGKVAINDTSVAFSGELAPGPDYKLYFSPTYVETESDFNELKNTMVAVGDIKSFSGFVLDLPPGFNPADYTSVIVWCESFGEFITSAQYQ